MVLKPVRAAVAERWGMEVLSALEESLSAEARTKMAALSATSDWVPENYLTELAVAIWEGPIQRNQTNFLRLVRRQLDLGFGSIRRVLLGIATPVLLCARASALWRRDHDTGILAPSIEGDNAMVLRISNFDVARNPIMRLVYCESFRHITSLNRGVRETKATHTFEAPNSMTVRVRWC